MKCDFAALEFGYGTCNVIMGPRHVNRGPWNEIMEPCSVFIGPWNMNRGQCNVNR